MEYGNNNLDNRESQELYNAFELADNIVYRKYVNRLDEFEIEEMNQESASQMIGKNIRLLKIEKIIYDKDENNLQKLTNIYNMAYSQKLNLCMVLNSDGDKVELYIGICQENENDKLRIGINVLGNGFSGNFPGSMRKNEKNEFLNLLTSEENADVIHRCMEGKNAISAVSGVAGARNEKEEDNLKFVQGIEKLIDGMRGEPFSCIIIANPIGKDDLQKMKNELETLYTSLKPFEKTVMNFSESHAKGVSNSLSKGFSDSYGKSKSDSLSLGTSESTSKTKGHSEGISAGIGGMVSGALTIGAGVMFGPIGASAAGTISKGINSNLGVNASMQHSKTETKGTSRTTTETSTKNEQHTTTNTNTTTDTSTDTNGNVLQIEYLNKSVKQLLDQIDQQLTRMKKCESYGVFAAASYFLARNAGYSSMAASIYKSLISGENTAVESAHISTWDNDGKVSVMKKYLESFYHPVFRLLCGDNQNDVTAASIVSGNELAIYMNLPKKSVSGVVVSECIPFGRNIYKLSGEKTGKTIEIGNIYHMCSDEETEVKLCVNDLSMHTFVTGATGSGKSNAVYTMIEKLTGQEVKFLVIEPAKGEYKYVFGSRNDVSVYGTNPKKNKMLRINPFRFPEDIHVLEHIDKLIEIFNVCWPMYAAMPAVLKEAVEKAYISVGWNLDTSENVSGRNIYPSFDDVLRKLAEVIEKSEFSEEVKSNYAGALLTRVRSLTNGINGRIFAGNEIESKDLFDQNVIIDLSRVGASDTKSLIMGILVMKLQEYRMSEGGINQSLKHVTVLEEAHNLLKASGNSVGAAEGADLVGKSVEMLSNIIAEVRTYGEGFIIADQAPGLLDASVIRNTNTKIILRLPDYEDRKLVGKAANLSDEQIEELAKLPVGVAAVYHNDWLEPVLCHISKFEMNKENQYKDEPDRHVEDNRTLLLKYLTDSVSGKETNEDIDRVERLLQNSRISSELKIKLLGRMKESEKIDSDLLKRFIIDVYGNCDTAFYVASEAKDIQEWNRLLVENIDRELTSLDIEYQNTVISNILEERAKKDIYYEDMNLKWTNYMTRHGLI